MNKLSQKLLLAVGFAAALLCSAAANAQVPANSIDSINVTTQTGGAIVVRVALKEALANLPAAFAIDNPPRIAFDLMGVANATGKARQEVGDGDLKSLNLVQTADRTRLVLNLGRQVGYDAKIDGKNLLIVLQSTGSGAAPATAGGAAPAVSHFAEQKAKDNRHSVRDVDFRRGNKGEARIVVELSDNQVGIDLRNEGKKLVVDFLNTGLPKNLERRLDVADFGTPVTQVDTFTQGNNTRISIEPRGNWEQSAYQADNRFIIEVRPIVEDPNKLIQGSRQGYQGEKLSLNFQNVEVRAVLQVIADFTGLNIITSDTVGGNLTLRLKDVPWDQALDIILQAKGLDMRKNGNVVWIAPREELATKEKLALEAQAQIADLEPLRTESFVLNYMKADAFQKIVTDKEQRILSKRGSAVIDPRTNTLFVQDTPARLEELRRLIRQIDIPVRQVMIESRIVEASDTFSRNLGVRLGINTREGSPIANTNSQVMLGGSLDATGFFSSQIATPIPSLAQTLGVNLPAPNINGRQAGAFSLVLFNDALTRFLNLELSALEADGKGKIISSPRVITADQTEASIEQGTEIPYQQATSSGATSISFKKATLSLKVKPQITPDDNIIMKLDIHKDAVGTVTASGPSIDTKQVSTEVLVDNGGTVVIGGIYQSTEINSVTKVPVLGDLPYIGFLFRQDLRQDDKSELLVFISPRILKNNLTLR
ncbi:MAG: type IV pilus secretin PilQ [Burkholderiales bacterium]